MRNRFTWTPNDSKMKSVLIESIVDKARLNLVRPEEDASANFMNTWSKLSRNYMNRIPIVFRALKQTFF